jgi:hypothetical protein
MCISCVRGNEHPAIRVSGNFDLANLWADPKSSDSSCKKGLRLATDLRHHAAGLSTARYRVDRAMPKRAAISATGISAVLSRARMVLISLGESFAGRPPLRPRARADFNRYKVELSKFNSSRPRFLRKVRTAGLLNGPRIEVGQNAVFRSSGLPQGDSRIPPVRIERGLP